MAKSFYEKQRKNFGDYLNKQNNQKTTKDKMASQLKNYETRANAAGVEKDSRNFIEKALNLPEDQNVLFDIFEILDRPRNALFGGIQEAQEGGDFFDGLGRGISGTEQYYGGDILRNMGVDDTPLFENPLTGDDTSLSDILGLGLDIFADPIDMKIGSTGKSLLENAVGGVGKVGKKALGASDNLVTKGLSKLDNKHYYDTVRQLGVDTGLLSAKGIKKVSKTQLDDVAEVLAKQGVDVNRYTNNLVDVYQGAKKGLKRTANYAESVPANLYNKVNRVDNAVDSAVFQSRKIIDDVTNSAGNYASTVGKNVDNVLDDVNTLISSRYAPEVSGYDFLQKTLKDGKATIEGTQKEIADFAQKFKQLNREGYLVDDILNFKITNDGTKLTLKRTKGLDAIVNNNANRNILDNIKYANKPILSPENAKRVTELENLYNSDNLFRELVDNSNKSYDTVNELIREATGQNVDFKTMLREGYTRNTMTDFGKNFEKEAKRMGIDLGKRDLNIGSKATTSAKKYSNVAEEAESQIQSSIGKQIERKQKAIEKAPTYENKVKDLEQKIATKQAEKIERTATYESNIAKLNISKAEKESLIKGAKVNLDDLKDTIKDTMKKASISNIDDSIPTKFIDKANKYTDSLDDLQKVYTKLDNPNLTQAEVSKIYGEYKNAEAKVLKNQTELYKEKARIDGAILKKETKNIKKAVDISIDSSSKFTKQQLKNEAAYKNIEKRLKSVEEGYNKISINLDRQINNYGLELDRLKNMTAEEITKYNEKSAKYVGKLQRDIDFLKSAEGMQFYETAFDKGIADFINMTAEDAKALNRYNEIILHAGLSDENVMKFIPKGEKAGKIPAGYKRLDSEDAKQMLSLLENKKNFLPESQDLIKEFSERLSDSGAVIMDKDAYSMLKLNINENEVKPFVKMIDGFNNTFKKYKVFTPGFHLRNISGNATNMVMSGVPIREIPGLYSKANKLTNTDYIVDLFSKKIAGNLTDIEKADLDIINKFMQGGFLGKGKEIQDLGAVVDKAAKNVNKTELGKLVDKVFTGNMNLNEWVDNRNRMALLLYADKNPKYLKKLGANDSISAVKKVLFDPNNLSDFEKTKLKKIIPFYTFTKQNLMFHADNIMRNTSKYKRLIKTFDETYDALPQDTYRQYQKENMQIPIGRDENGNVTTLKSNLPVSDLGEYLEDPIKRLVSSTSPLIKAPFEAATGVDTFTGQPLYKSTPDQLASWLGIDSITTAQANKIKNLFEDIEDDATLTKKMSDLIPSVMQYNDAEKIETSRMYEELQEYQQLFRELKKEGIDIPTIRELKDTSNITLKNLRQRRNKLKRS